MTSSDTSVHQIRLLLLEDQDEDARLLIRVLQRAEISFVWKQVHTRTAFIEGLKEFRPDLILSDYSLPQFNGMAALEIAKELMPTTPFIIVTGSISEETAVECMKAGATDYVLKGHLVLLVPSVKEALDRKRLAEEKVFTEEALRKSEARLAEAEQIAHLGHIEWSLETHQISWSEEVFRILGVSPAIVTPSLEDFYRFVHPADKRAFVKTVDALLRPGRPPSMEYRIIRPSGEERFIFARVSAEFDNEEKPLRLFSVIQDVTDEKLTEAELLRATQAMEETDMFLKSVIENLPVALFCKDVNNEFRHNEWNKMSEELFGLTREEIVGKNDHDLFSVDQADFFRTVDIEVVAKGELVDIPVEPIDVKGRGTIFLHTKKIPIRGSDGRPKYLLGISEDITERKKTEESLKESHKQLRALAARLQRIREEERKTIAREIHDELGQALTGIKMDVAWLGRRIDELLSDQDAKPLNEKIKSVFQLIDDTIQTVRRLATQLRPGILDDLGLVAALEWQLQEFQRRSGVHTEFVSEVEEIPIEGDRLVATFRIFQEALTNVSRHSHATQVFARCQYDGERVTVEVRDNGVGMIEGEYSNQQSLGILGMRERAILFGGGLTIASEVGNGTTVRIEMPLNY